MRRLAISALTLISVAYAIEPDEQLADPALEARARALSREIRCVVCQSESIDDSNAPLARDLRLVVRERITAGDTNAQVKDYLVARYGDFVLLKPRLTAGTVALWLAPAVAALAGLVGAFVVLRRRRERDKPAPLSAEETAALRGIEE